MVAVGVRPALLAAAGIVALVGSCRLDATDKDHCVTTFDCNAGHACIAETCVPFDQGGQASAPPLMYVGGLQRHDCDQTSSAYVAGQAMRLADFTQTPLIAAGSAFNATGKNQDSRAMISVTAGITSQAFWFDVLVTTRADAAAARRWRDALVTQLQAMPVSCGIEAGTVTSSEDPTFWLGPPLTWYSEGRLTPTASCDPLSFCTSAARKVLIRRGLTPGPTDPTSPVIVAADGNIGIAVTCADFGAYAVFTVVTSSVDGAGQAWASPIADAIAASPCR